MFKIGDVVKQINSPHLVDLKVKPPGDVGIVIGIRNPTNKFVMVKYFNGITTNNEEVNLKLVKSNKN